MGKVEQTIEIDAPVEVCYRIWAGFESFPSFMENIRLVSKTDSPSVWHWIVDGPMNTTLEWDARVDVMEPNQRIAWHSLPDSELETSGEVRFSPLSENKTLLSVSMEYDLELGGFQDRFREWFIDLFQDPEKMVAKDLKAFQQHVKHYLSTHETHAIHPTRY